MCIHVCIRFQPTQEEREMYKNYTGDKKQLPLADSFLLKVYTHIRNYICGNITCMYFEHIYITRGGGTGLASTALAVPKLDRMRLTRTL